MSPTNIRRAAGVLGVLGILGVLLVHWMVFFWVPTEATMGVVQRIFYIHVPAAWVAFLAFGIVALCGGMYLWLGDDRLDMAAEAAAEGGMVFATIMITSGPLWGKIAWGTYWTWEPRLTLTLLLWFIYLGYFLVRRSTSNPEQGKKFSAVVGIVGVLDIPLIHISVSWLRSLHPQPVVIKPDGPSLDPAMLTTLMTGLLAFTILFFGLFLARYGVSQLRHAAEVRAAPAPVG
jgi:heme exporter protein C